MTNLAEISDLELRTIESRCEAEIVDRILDNKWPHFFEDPNQSHDIAQVCADTLAEMLVKPRGADVIVATFEKSLRKVAENYAYLYVLYHSDVQDLAITLGVE